MSKPTTMRSMATAKLYKIIIEHEATIERQQKAIEAVRIYRDELNNTESDGVLTTNVMVRLNRALDKAGDSK